MSITFSCIYIYIYTCIQLYILEKPQRIKCDVGMMIDRGVPAKGMELK